MNRLFTLPLALFTAMAVNAQQSHTVTFEAAALAEDGTLQGTSYTEAGFVFDNYYTNEGWEYNSGYTVSNNTDRSTAGFMNQYSVDARGGAAGSKNFVIYNPCYYGDCYIHRADNGDFAPTNVAVALTTYTAISTQDGDSNSKQFGYGDYYTMTVKGLDSEGKELSSVDIKLIDYPMSLMPWTVVNLSQLGTVNKLLISFASSDSSPWGINTPAYIALDNFTAQTPNAVAVASVKAANKATIHNVDGTRSADTSRPGIYIAGGKKVAVK